MLYEGDDMKKNCRLVSFILIVVMALGFVSACSYIDSNELDGSVVSISDNPVPLAHSPVVLIPEAPGLLFKASDKAVIDYSNTADGYIMVKWQAETDKQLRVLITGPCDTLYTYAILPDDSFNVFPLSDGNGLYEISIVEQTEGDRYALVLGYEADVILEDEFAPFLRPNQFVNFTADSAVVIKAAELVAGMDTTPEKIGAIYDFVVNNIKYDVDFANAVVAGQHKGYVPDVDAVLLRRFGICFDYAALMTAMLRSQGIPAKLVIGYAGEVRHAWVSVFSDEIGSVDKAAFFDAQSWVLMDPTFAATTSSAAALQDFINDNSNYIVLFVH